MSLDRLSALEIATRMNRQDAKVSRAVREALPAIAEAIEVIRERLARGGRLIYVGSGTSGRIGALDASECPPTFGTAPAMVQAMIAGGDEALGKASEGSEDSAELGASDMAGRRPGRKDVVVGLSASGQTPYTVAALQYAAKKGRGHHRGGMPERLGAGEGVRRLPSRPRWEPRCWRVRPG